MTVDLSRIPKLEEVSDEELPNLLDQEESRQLFHITHELLLNTRSDSGKNLFIDRLSHILTEYEEDYWSMIEKHLEKYLSCLGVKKKEC